MPYARAATSAQPLGLRGKNFVVSLTKNQIGSNRIQLQHSERANND
jgi:hypothetical protein